MHLGMKRIHRQDIASFGHQTLRDGATDETSSTGDENPLVRQQFSLSLRPAAERTLAVVGMSA